MLAITDTQRVKEALMFMLTKEMGEPTIEKFPTNTYTFFFKDDYNIAIYEPQNLIPYIVVMSADYSVASNFDRLISKETVKSQIVWDLLEQVGIKEYPFFLLYKNGVPNQAGLEQIDWDAVT